MKHKTRKHQCTWLAQVPGLRPPKCHILWHYFIKILQTATTGLLAYIFVISQKSPSSQCNLSDVGALSYYSILMNISHFVLKYLLWKQARIHHYLIRPTQIYKTLGIYINTCREKCSKLNKIKLTSSHGFTLTQKAVFINL